MTQKYRAPTDWEKRIIQRLLEPEFPGREELIEQLESVLGGPIDENGSLELACQAPRVAPVIKRVPSEGEAQDVDGTTIHYLLHVVDGKMRELEVYKDDSSRVLRHAQPEDLMIWAQRTGPVEP